MFEALVGLRYLYAARSQGFVSFMVGASILGIALGVTALIIVFSVFNGLQRDLTKEFTVGREHIGISGQRHRIEDWRALDAALRRTPSVKSVVPVAQQPALLRGDGVTQGVFLQGVDPSKLSKSAVSAGGTTLEAGKYNIELSSITAFQLGVSVGDSVTVMSTEMVSSIAGAFPRYRLFTVSKVTSPTEMSAMAQVHLADAQKLFQLGDTVSAITVSLDDPLTSPDLVKRLNKAYPQLMISDWTSQFEGFFRVLDTQKRISALLLSLLVAVAAFNLVASMMMTVSARKAEIAILRTMGTTPGGIQRIFLIQGGVMGLLGAGLGMAGGIPLASHVGAVVQWLEALTGINFTRGLIGFASTIPSEVRPAEVCLLGLAAFGLTMFATLFPSWRASRVAPAEALR